MLHRTRTWTVHQVPSAEELSEQLANHSWTLCTGFCVSGHNDYVFVNDSTREDALQEFAVLKRDGTSFRQIESFTVSWCTYESALNLIRQVFDGAFDNDLLFGHTSPNRLQQSSDHGTCPLCA